MALELFLTLSVISMGCALYVRYQENTIDKAEIAENEKALVDYEVNTIGGSLSTLLSDVGYLVYTYHSDREYADSKEYDRLKENWKAFSDSKKQYSKIRYLDADGNEIIRINYASEGSFASDTGELQNKKDRYYFLDTIGLSENQTYISKLDLNVENGLIEIPIKPVLRLSTPLVSGGEKKGILVITYNAATLLENFENTTMASYGNVFLLNSDGYWLVNAANKQKEWAFMYNGNASVSFKNEFPDEWKAMNSNNAGSFITESGLYTYSHLSAYAEDRDIRADNGSNTVVPGEGDCLIVSFVPNGADNGVIFNDSFLEIAQSEFISKKYIFSILFLFSVLASSLIAANRRSREKIRLFSYDILTGAYNRHSGFELLSKTHKRVSKQGGKLSVCFLDVNGLKNVNDSFGHEAGDELIRCVADAIKKGIRDSDFIIRVGGDEFLIVLVNVDLPKAEEIWRRIEQAIKETNEKNNLRFVVSVSHGIEEFHFDINEFIDDIVNSADEKMYNEKREMKKALDITSYDEKSGETAD